MRALKAAYGFFAIIICLLILFASFSYLTPNFSKGFLSYKQDIFPYYKYFFYAHIFAGPLAFLAGLFQIAFPRNSFHKVIGKFYLITVVGFAAPGGFFMAFYAIGGLINTINFALMAALWIFFTFKAFLLIRDRNIEHHQQYMTRSFIMANSAILIRLFSFFNHQYQLMDVTLGYIIISFASWLPWLIFFELQLRLKTVKDLLK